MNLPDRIESGIREIFETHKPIAFWIENEGVRIACSCGWDPRYYKPSTIEEHLNGLISRLLQ